MTNDVLQKILQRFPGTCEIELQSGGVILSVDHAEYVTSPEAHLIGDAGVGWADLIRESIKVRLVAKQASLSIDDLSRRLLRNDAPTPTPDTRD